MSHFIPEPRNFLEVKRLPADIKVLVEINFENIKNIINNQTFIMGEPDKL